MKYGQTPLTGHYEVQSAETALKSDEFFNTFYKLGEKRGYFPVRPWDSLQDLRSEMVVQMSRLGLQVEASHHEVAAPGQCEIDIRFDSMRTVADKLMW